MWYHSLILALFGNVFNNIFTNRTHFDLLYNKSLSFCAFCTYTVTFLCVFYLFTIVLFFYAMNLLKEFSIFESLLLMTFFHTQWVPVRNYFLFALVCIPSGTFIYVIRNYGEFSYYIIKRSLPLLFFQLVLLLRVPFCCMLLNLLYCIRLNCMFQHFLFLQLQ